jgi:hypothetical protein
MPFGHQAIAKDEVRTSESEGAVGHPKCGDQRPCREPWIGRITPITGPTRVILSPDFDRRRGAPMVWKLVQSLLAFVASFMALKHVEVQTQDQLVLVVACFITLPFLLLLITSPLLRRLAKAAAEVRKAVANLVHVMGEAVDAVLEAVHRQPRRTRR